MSLPLSLIILAKNEERHLPRLLASAANLGSELIVVDSGSTDRTLDIAKEAGAMIVHQAWLGMAEQRRFGLEQAQQPWVLCLDCDEELSAELGQAIIAFFESGRADRCEGASFARKTWFFGPLDHAWRLVSRCAVAPRAAGRRHCHGQRRTRQKSLFRGQRRICAGICIITLLPIFLTICAR